MAQPDFHRVTPANTKPSEPQLRVDALRQASEQITRGANPCPDCGSVPHGIEQPRSVAGIGEFYVYEIGCLVCRDHRALGTTREQAVAKFNAGEFLPATDQASPAPAPAPRSP